MKSLPAWSNANKISLYVHKTWLTFLTSKEKIRWKRKQNLVEKDIYHNLLTTLVLNFNWKHNINGNATELSTKNAVLFQIKKNLVWVQDLNALNRVLILQNRPWELSIFNQGLAIQVLYFWNTILIKTEVKTLLGNALWKIITHSPMIHDPSMHNSCIN